MSTERAKRETYFLPAPHTYQLTSGKGEKAVGRRQNGAGAGGVLMEEEGTHSTIEREGEDLKGERRGFHVMYFTSRNNKQSYTSAPTVQSPIGTATGFPRKAASKTEEVPPIVSETPLTLPSPLLPKL